MRDLEKCFLFWSLLSWSSLSTSQKSQRNDNACGFYVQFQEQTWLFKAYRKVPNDIEQRVKSDVYIGYPEWMLLGILISIMIKTGKGNKKKTSSNRQNLKSDPRRAILTIGFTRFRL